MKKIFFSLAVFALALLASANIVAAQGDGLQISLSRNVGFSLGNQIQGSFNIAASGRDDLASVTFLIDGKEMTTVTAAPFRYSFSTDSYSTGQHQFSATARTTGGQTVKSNVLDVEIVTATQGWQASTRIIYPLLGVVLLVIVIVVGVQVLPFGRNKRPFVPGEQRDYGPMGGAICPRCGRPFARNFLSMNLMFGKLERCPYCGKWSITRPASIEALRAAEQAEVQGAKAEVHEITPEERLRQQIEESRMSR